MKKKTAVILAFTILFSLIAAVSSVCVFADDDTDEVKVTIDVPDNAWEGGRTEFKGKDGSVTTVYDNGSVWTKYADGTESGVDYNGNKHVEDKDGTYTISGTDGSVATQYSDGRMSYSEGGSGKTTTYNTDGSFSETYSTFGITVDYDADGAKTGIGFTDSSERIGVDENGYYKNGEIKGPNGSSLVIKDDEKHLLTSDGTKVDYKESGVTDSSDGYTESFSVTFQDGTKQYWDINTTSLRDQNGIFTGNRKSNSGGIDLPDGTKFQYEGIVTFDKDGNPVYIDQNASQFTGSDGSTLWKDGNSKALEYRDPNTGATFIVDKNGNLLENKSDEVTFTATYDENGNLVSADIEWKDGAHQVHNPDGTGSFTLPDGTKYESDGKGNVYKDGVQIKKDGKWLPGYGPTESTDDGKFKTKDNTFFGVTLPVPDVGRVTMNETEVNSFGEEVTTIRIDGMSYEQYKEYCQTLEDLPGWEVYEGSFPEDVAHFPEDYNSQSKVDFAGNYKSLPHISVHYYSDKQCEKNGYPHFCMFIFRNWD